MSTILKRKISEIKPNPKNPRVIKDDKFKKLVKSITDFPQMLEKRPLVCFTDADNKLVVLGGNMRLKAAQEVGLVAANTYFIAHLYFLHILVCSFLISFTWTWNVKRVVFGELKDRIIYASGAACGGITGVVLSKYVLL